MRPADAQVAFKPLAVISITQLEAQGKLDLTVTTPNDATWKRIRHSWGDPDYIVALVPKRRAYQYYCFDNLGVFVSNEQGRVSTRNARSIYGYRSAEGDSSKCKTNGAMFQIPPGITVQIHITARGEQVAPDTEVIVMPDWFFAKDNIVGLGLDEDWRTFANWSAPAGFIMVLVSAFFSIRARRLRRQATRPLDVTQ